MLTPCFLGSPHLSGQKNNLQLKSLKVKTYYKYLNLKTLFLALLATGIVSCETNGGSYTTEEKTEEIKLPGENSNPIEEEKLPLLISYHIDSIKTASEVDSFKTRFSEPEQEFIFALNRMDARRLNEGDEIIIPDTLTQKFLDYSPFPQYFEMLDSIPKTVLISRRVQGFALYEKGNLIRWGPVSSGKQSTQTPAGLFYGNYKARSKVSTVNDSWLMPYYFNFMNFEGVGVHQYSMPGYPASHACVRLKEVMPSRSTTGRTSGNLIKPGDKLKGMARHSWCLEIMILRKDALAPAGR